MTLTTYSGLDLAAVDDITALVHWIPDVEDRTWVIPRFFCPEITIRNAHKQYQRQYEMWAKQGFLMVTPGEVTNYGFIREQIFRDADQLSIKMLGFDPWQALQIATEIEAAGLETLEIRQTHGNLWPGVKLIEEKIGSRELAHDGNPVMTWMMSNVVMSIDPNGNRKPDKKKSHGVDQTKGKIDGISAMVMAAVCSQSESEQPDGTYYEENELEMI